MSLEAVKIQEDERVETLRRLLIKPVIIIERKNTASIKLCIIELLASGMSYKEIANEMVIPIKTIHNYSNDLKKTLGAKSLAHLIHIAYQNGLLEIK